jgi:hypothetical protein
MTATEDNKVVGVGDDMGTERIAAAGQTPVLQESVHVDIGEQRAHDALNAKDNFHFERKIFGWRRHHCVLDLRRKR